MRRVAAVVCMGVLSLGATADIRCDLSDLFFRIEMPLGVDVELANNTDFPIRVVLAFDPDEYDPGDDGDLFDDGDEIHEIVWPGEVVVVSLTCDEATAVGIERAKLLLLDEPAIGTPSYWIDEDFFCGETVAFDFFLDGDLEVVVSAG